VQIKKFILSGIYFLKTFSKNFDNASYQAVIEKSGAGHELTTMAINVFNNLL